MLTVECVCCAIPFVSLSVIRCCHICVVCEYLDTIGCSAEAYVFAKVEISLFGVYVRTCVYMCVCMYVCDVCAWFMRVRYVYVCCFS